ncbi:hypothetical protein [Sphingopyxis sp. BSNA05]|uniref:hypothetical protein n=1 Tax=Sphingopyxis sp. BSNA05 TaxID=1236614 RepID=UPI0020B7215D|nr:hypothetical protein [Sphingopyxis sp. BSNA05]
MDREHQRHDRRRHGLAQRGRKVSGYGFVLFCGSSIVWIAASLLDGNNPLAIQNVVLFGINIFGVYRYLWRKPNEKAAD